MGAKLDEDKDVSQAQMLAIGGGRVVHARCPRRKKWPKWDGG